VRKTLYVIRQFRLPGERDATANFQRQTLAEQGRLRFDFTLRGAPTWKSGMLSSPSAPPCRCRRQQGGSDQAAPIYGDIYRMSEIVPRCDVVQQSFVVHRKALSHIQLAFIKLLNNGFE
jgi:hypothetical protein